MLVHQSLLSILVLAVVLVLVSARGLWRRPPPIWGVLLAGAVAVVLLGQISLHQAVAAIDWHIMGFLFGSFILATHLEHSGVIEKIAARFFYQASAPAVLTRLVFFCGLSSALLMNDTLAIVGIPIILNITTRHPTIRPILLLALAYSVTIGSVMSPIGNPQNLLIASSSGIHNPVLTFLLYLAVPTLLSLYGLTWLLRWQFATALKSSQLAAHTVTAGDINSLSQTKKLTYFSSSIFLSLIFLMLLSECLNFWLPLDFSGIALLAAAPILLFSPDRRTILRSIDWGTLLFFIGLFVLVKSVWLSGVMQTAIARMSHIDSVPVIFLIASLGSQIISNVPLVALYVPLLH